MIFRPVLIALVFLLSARGGGAQVSGPSPREPEPVHITVLTPAKAETLAVTLTTTDRPPGPVRYTVHPAPGVELLDARAGTLTWDPANVGGLQLRLRLIVSAGHAGGRIVAARVALQWSDGSTESVGVPVEIRPEPDTAVSSPKDLEAELVPIQRGAPPGGAVRLRFSIVNLEETDQRLQLRVVAGPGWRLVNSELAQREWLIETFNWLEGEIELAVPDDAQVGDRQLVRLLVDVVGEPGEIDAHNYVSVTRRGGAKPGVPTLSGSATIGLSQLGVGGLDAARRLRAFTLSSKFRPESNFSVAFDQGLQENLSNFRYEEARTRVSGSLRHAGWNVSFGNYVAAQGNALSGPFVLGRGLSVQRPAGRLLSELIVAQPNTIAGVAGGHVVRGRAGLRTPTLTIAFSASDFSRPAGGYTTISTVQTTVLDPAAQEEIDFERRLTASSASNRVEGFGLDTEFRPAAGHRFAFRTGGLWLSNAAGDRVGARVGEASYGLYTKRARVNARWRNMPPTVLGIFIPADDLAGDGSLSLGPDLQLVGRAYVSSTATFGRELSSRTEGASFGLRFARGARRLEVRGNYRESQYSRTTVRRTVSVLAGTPVGPFTLSGNVDVGEQDTTTRVDPIALYRGDLRWMGKAGTVSLGASHLDTAGVRRQRIDLLASLRFRRFELAGGAWATSGYPAGGRPGVWTHVGVPVGLDSMLLFGADHSPLTWTSTPSLRGMVSFRKTFTLPLPFISPIPPAGTPASPAHPAGAVGP